MTYEFVVVDVRKRQVVSRHKEEPAAERFAARVRRWLVLHPDSIAIQVRRVVRGEDPYKEGGLAWKR